MIRRAVSYIPVYGKQEQFCRSTKFVTGFVAGRGSGKSFIGSLRILQTAKHGETWMAISPTYRVVEDTTWPTFKDLAERLGVWKGGSKHPSPSAKFRTSDGGEATLKFRTAENPDLLRGANNAGIWFDEASVMHKDAFDYAIPSLRHRGKMGKCFLTFTPRGMRHWTFQVFYEPCQDERAVGTVEINGRLFRQTGNSELIRAHTLENPFLAAEFYDTIRARYSSTLAAQELGGEFVELEGLLFRREWFVFVDQAPRRAARVRYWDRAATPGSGCYTAGVLMARGDDGLFYVEDAIKGQWSAGERDQIIEETARKDARRYNNEVMIYAEQEGGSAGKEISEQFIRRMAGFPVYRDIVSGKRARVVDKMQLPGEAKINRAMPFAAQAEAGNVRVVRGVWSEDWLEQHCAFPEMAEMDLVDATSGAFAKLARYGDRDPGEVVKAEMDVGGEQFGLTLIKSRMRRRGL